MKTKRMTRLIVSVALTSFLCLSTINVYAMGDLNEIMLQDGMDEIMSQSYDTIDNSHEIADDAENGMHLADIVDDPMFFIDVLDINENKEDKSEIVNDNDSVSAIENGNWSNDFNDFFSGEPSSFPVDVDMENKEVVTDISAFDNPPVAEVDSNLEILDDMEQNNASSVNDQMEIVDDLVPQENLSQDEQDGDDLLKNATSDDLNVDQTTEPNLVEQPDDSSINDDNNPNKKSAVKKKNIVDKAAKLLGL